MVAQPSALPFGSRLNENDNHSESHSLPSTSLDRLTIGQRARIVALRGDLVLVQRLMEMGMLEGDEVELLAVAPLGDPIELRLGDSRLSVRRADAARVEVEFLP